MADPRQDLFDELLDDALEVLRLAAGERRRVQILFNEMEVELRRILSEVEFVRFTKALFDKLTEEGNEAIAAIYSKIYNSSDYSGIALYIYRATSHSFEISLGVDALKKPSPAYMRSVKSNVMIEGAPIKDWWNRQNADLQFKFAQQVRIGLTAGETNQKIIQRIVGKSGEAGIMDAARRHASTLVQTGVQAVANDARRKTFQANDDIVKGIQQVSTLDAHTSPTCIAYSGCKWDLDFKPIGSPRLPYNGGTPRHMNCRSLETPITKTFAEMGLDIPEPKPTTRASDEGQIAADITFDGFLKRKSKAYVDEMLGEGKADLWRAGKITLKDLVNGDGRPRTLKELNELVRKRQAR